MTRQLCARLSVISLSIKKVCLRQYHFSMEGMRKGFLFCQRGWTLGASPPSPSPSPSPNGLPEKRPVVSRNGCLGYSSLRGRRLKEKGKGVIQTAELTSSSMLLITSSLHMMNSKGKHIYFLKMSLLQKVH